MDFRIGYRRPLRTVWLLRKKRQRIRLAIAAAVAVAGGVAAMTWHAEPSTATTAATAATALPLAFANPPATAKATRRVYPYSIVPGGVATRADLEQRVRTDQVVARHYASFDVKKAHALAVPKARAVYVSYRKGDKVYWTANKVMLAAGETVLSDGTSEIRGRCGNRISDKAQLPVAMNEPTEEELDASMNVAMDPDVDGSLQNASMGLDDALPAGSATQFQNVAAYTQADQAPVSPHTRSAMPAVPAFSTGIPGAMGMQSTRLLLATSGPTDAFGPTTAGAATVTLDTSTSTASATPAAGSASAAITAPVAAPATAAATDPAISVTAAPATVAEPLTLASAAIAASAAALAPDDNSTASVIAASAAASTPGAATPTVSLPVASAKALPEGDIPEPATLWLTGVAFAAMLLAGRRRAGSPRA